MTFFLNDKPNTQIPARSAPAPVPSYGQALGANIRASALENDANFRVSREKTAVKSERALKAGGRVGLPAVLAEMEKRGISYKGSPPKSIEEAVQKDWRAQIVIDELAEAQAAENPDAWADIDMSEKWVDGVINEKLQAEYQDAQDIIAMTPEGYFGEQFLGALVGTTADVKNIPFLVLGGGTGSLARKT